MDNQDNPMDNSVESLIANVRERRSLWQQRLQNVPGIKKMQQRMWSEVASRQNSAIDDVKKQWQSLRSGFQRRLQKIPRNENQTFSIDPHNFPCPWKYYQQMLFLVNPKDLAVTTDRLGLDRKKRPRQNKDTASESNADNSPKRIKVSSSSGNLQENLPLSLNASHSNDSWSISGLDTTQNESDQSVEVEVTPELNQVNFDSDYLFLLSFYEFLRPLPSVQKLTARAAISLAISKVIENTLVDRQEN